MGRVRFLSKKEEVRLGLLMEALTRTMKCQLRELYRKKTNHLRHPSSDPFRKITVEYFNLVLGAGQYKEKSEEFWEGPLKKTLLEKFEKVLSKQELANPNLKLKDMFFTRNLNEILLRLASFLNITLSRDARDDLKQIRDSSKRCIFAATDVVSIETRVKHFNILENAAAMSLIYQSEDANEETATKLLNAAQKILSVNQSRKLFFTHFSQQLVSKRELLTVSPTE